MIADDVPRELKRLDAAIAEGGDAGTPIVIAQPRGPHAAAFAKIAAAVARRTAWRTHG